MAGSCAGSSTAYPLPFTTGNCHKPGDMVALDGDISSSYVVTELILPGIALKELVQIDIPAMKSQAVTQGFQAACADFLLRITH